MQVDVLELSAAAGVTIERNVALGPHTSLKIGGPADLFARARGARELSRVLSAAHERDVPWLLVGGGSNMLVADRGFRGLAIKIERPATRQRNSADVIAEDAKAVHLRCDAGLQTAGLSRWTASMGWSGLEWGCGVPGTIGGAAAGNAGAYGGDMAHVVERVYAWFPGGEREIGGGEMGYAYRTSRFKRSPEPSAVLSVDLRLARAAKEDCLARIEANERNRREKQPTERSCGSVFKNPPGDASGRLIDVTGLKGTAIGGAQVSEKHGNFFVNRGDATASDVIALVKLARERVEAAQGMRLEVEILLVGDWDPQEVASL